MRPGLLKATQSGCKINVYIIILFGYLDKSIDLKLQIDP